MILFNVNARDVIEQILKEKEDRRLLMFITLWFLWTERNIVREEGCRRSAETITRAIQIYAGEWGETNISHSGAPGSGAPGATLGKATRRTSKSKLWCFPHTGWVAWRMGIFDQGKRWRSCAKRLGACKSFAECLLGRDDCLPAGCPSGLQFGNWSLDSGNGCAQGQASYVGSTEGEEHVSICHAMSRIVSM